MYMNLLKFVNKILKEVTVEEQLHQLSERDCTSPVQCEKPFTNIKEPERFQKRLFRY